MAERVRSYVGFYRIVVAAVARKGREAQSRENERVLRTSEGPMRKISTSSLLFTSAFLAATAFAVGASADTAPQAVEYLPADFAPVESSEVAGEILVDMKDEATASDIAAVESLYGIKLHANSPHSSTLGKYEIADVDAADESALIDRLSKDARIEHA